jgi:hypothetical protein
MKTTGIVFFLLLIFLNSLSQSTQIVYLSGTDSENTVKWDFFCTEGKNSGKWTTIPVPSNWELQGFGNYNYGHDYGKKDRKLGKETGLYRHEFKVPAGWKGKIVKIVFDGSMTDTKVKINGKPAGEVHQGAFYRFKYDITKLLKYGSTNQLEVEVAKHSANESVNRAERQCDFWIFGGIFRPVFLEILPEVYINRTAINARANGSFTMQVSLNRPSSGYSVEVELSDLAGNKNWKSITGGIPEGKSEGLISGSFDKIKAWNPEWPSLYTMKISLKKGQLILHEITERIGFRSIELRKHDGFYVNGEKVVFKGVCRHSSWPETGKCLSDANHLLDIRLIKEMNMNAVRMSHYIPDKRFLELCDSLGLFVLDEVTGWQKSYDTIVGPKLIKEAILKDENHPCVIAWDHGNEGGWDFANEKWFHVYDIQKRPVIYPWLLRNGVDTHHYPEFDYSAGRFIYGNDPFMPTEFLHGLYDGGHGAALAEYWRNYESSPLFAGAFLWVFADEAVLRTDLPGRTYDSDGNLAPDGILSPHREKEASFFTVKQLWSPVRLEPVTVNRQWDGKLRLTNKFIYTNLNQCTFRWKAIKTGFGLQNEKVIGSGSVKVQDTSPGETSLASVDCKEALQTADLFLFSAFDPNGAELYTWSWPVIQPEEKAIELVRLISSPEKEINITENETEVTASIPGLTVIFSKKTGELKQVRNSKGILSLSGGPVPAGIISEVTGTKCGKDAAGDFVFEISTKNYPRKMTWKLLRNGLLYLEASPLQQPVRDIDFIGISFRYPEVNCKSMEWMGRGPYRVWKNRLDGSNIGFWKKDYNNTITGESYNDLIYPEFKGYHGNLFWCRILTTESPITVISATPNLYLQLFKPAKPKFTAGGTYPPFPDGDISFLYEIPAIGTKFNQPDKLGPISQKGKYSGHPGDEDYPIKLWFDLRGE